MPIFNTFSITHTHTYTKYINICMHYLIYIIFIYWSYLTYIFCNRSIKNIIKMSNEIILIIWFVINAYSLTYFVKIIDHFVKNKHKLYFIIDCATLLIYKYNNYIFV